MAPIPAAWGQAQADLAREKGHPRRPRPAPSPELASRLVQRGTGPGSAIPTEPIGLPVPGPQPSPSPRNRRRHPPWAAPRHSGGCRARVAGRPPSGAPLPDPAPRLRPLPSLTVRGARAPGGCQGAAAAGAGDGPWRAAAGAPAHARRRRSASGERTATSARKRAARSAELYLLKGASWYF